MVIEILEKLFRGNSPASSRLQAKSRLKLVIAHDRAGLTPKMIESMRQEILQVVARYVEVDAKEMEFSLESNERVSALIANLPILRVKPEINLEEKISQ